MAFTGISMLDIEAQDRAVEEEGAEQSTGPTQRIQHIPAVAGAASLAASALLAACGGGGGGSSESGSNSSGAAVTASSSTPAGTTVVAGTSPSPSAVAVAALKGYSFKTASTDEEASRFLLQAQFSASPAEISSVRTQGYATWLAAQLDAPVATTGVQWLDLRGYGTLDARTSYFDHSYPGDFMIWQQLMKSSDAVRKRLALALSELFVVSLNSLNIEWRSHAIAQYWDTLVNGTRSNFRTLLEDITLNPAMGLFLNTRGNQKEDAKGRQPDENYAREVMQLFTIGLYQLNPDGTEKRAGDGSKLATYAQADVSNLARVFTGYDLDTSQDQKTTVAYTGYTRNIGNTTPVTRRMVLTASKHSTLAATFLGTTIVAGTDGTAALKTALDTLFNHPNVGPFVGRQLIQRLVTSNPSPAYVARVAGVFDNNGMGVRGDMGAVFGAILLDDEARGPDGLASRSFGRLREPMVRFVQWGRTCGLESAAGSWKLDDLSDAGRLGQNPLRAPSVFNFFRPGYVPPSTAIAAANQVAPEFQIVNETTVGAYLNYMQDRIRYGIYVDTPAIPEHNYINYVPDIAASYSGELALVLDTTALVKRLNLLMCAGQLSADTQNRMIAALNATNINAASSADAKLNRVCAAVLMVLASPEYLIQK
jgi:uncharacterized protein (DUF1800 family)